MEIYKLLLEAFEQSCLFFPMALGIYLSFSILKTTDMTTEGSFVLGAGVFARLLNLQVSSFLGAGLAVFLGGMAGMGVSLIQAKNRINSLIAGIIGLFMLYTLNFQMMGRPNIGLHVDDVNFLGTKFTLTISIVLLVIFVGLLLKSRFGLQLRAFGVNSRLLITFGKNVEVYRLFGLGLSNALAALCGVFTALVNGYADLNMGFGMTLTGIGTVIIGQQIIKRFFKPISFNPLIEILCCFIGVYCYFLAVNGFLALGVDPIYLKFLLGLMLIILLRGKEETI